MGDQLKADKRAEGLGLPPVMFTWTLDQICAMMNLEEGYLKSTYLYYVGRSTGMMPRHMMKAVNIAPDHLPADWRVSAPEFMSWLKRMKFTLKDMTFLR